MKMIKRNRKQEKRTGWAKLTIAQFNDIVESYNLYTDEVERMNAIIEIVFGVDGGNLSVADYQNYMSRLGFINQPIPKERLKQEYTINGNRYRLQTEMNSFSVSQYIDLSNYAKQGDKRYNDILSVVLIPEGAKRYNDGYDINNVKNDLLALDVQTGYNIADFFLTNCGRFTNVFLRCFVRMMNRRMNRNQRERMNEQLEMLKTIMNFSESSRSL